MAEMLSAWAGESEVRREYLVSSSRIIGVLTSFLELLITCDYAVFRPAARPGHFPVIDCGVFQRGIHASVRPDAAGAGAVLFDKYHRSGTRRVGICDRLWRAPGVFRFIG